MAGTVGVGGAGGERHGSSFIAALVADDCEHGRSIDFVDGEFHGFRRCKTGLPSSLTTMANEYTPVWVSVGVQVKSPDAGSIVAPAGTVPARLNVSVLAGRSASVADVVKLIGASSSPLWAPIGLSVGAVFTSLTVTVIVSESARVACRRRDDDVEGVVSRALGLRWASR